MPSGGGDSRTVSTQELSDEQKQLLSGVIPIAQNYLKSDLKLYPKSTVPPLNARQRSANKELVSTAHGLVDPMSTKAIKTAQGLQSTGSDVGQAGLKQALRGAGTLGTGGTTAVGGLGQVLKNYGKAAKTMDFLQSGALLDPRTNPVLASMSNAAVRPIYQNLTRTVLPSIRGDYAGSNMFGGSRQGIAEGLAITDANQRAADVTTELQNNAFNQGLGAMLSSSNQAASLAGQGIGSGISGAVGGAGVGAQVGGTGYDTALRSLMGSKELGQLAFLPGLVESGVGQQVQGQQGAKLQEASSRYMTQQMLPFLKAQDVAGLAFGLGGGSAVTETSQPAQFDPLGTALGLGQLGLLGYGLGIFS